MHQVFNNEGRAYRISLRRKVPTANISLAYIMFSSKRGSRLFLGILHVACTNTSLLPPPLHRFNTRFCFGHVPIMHTAALVHPLVWIKHVCKIMTDVGWCFIAMDCHDDGWLRRVKKGLIAQEMWARRPSKTGDACAYYAMTVLTLVGAM